MYCPISNSNFDSVDSPIEDNTVCCEDCDICLTYKKVQFACFSESDLDVFNAV